MLKVINKNNEVTSINKLKDSIFPSTPPFSSNEVRNIDRRTLNMWKYVKYMKMLLNQKHPSILPTPFILAQFKPKQNPERI